LAQFVADQNEIDIESESGDIFLYHGTNCYRRWEIKRCGTIEPGRSNYSFFCSKADIALKYARAAILRDMANYSPNSLICEPVVLKVRFNIRTWLQVDFWQSDNPGHPDDKNNLSLAVLGPISADLINDVIHCNHGRRLNAGITAPLTNEALYESLQRLREKLIKRRADAWILKRLGGLSQNISVQLTGGNVPELTFADNLRRLRQVSAHIGV
jgi:hypothetical protein